MTPRPNVRRTNGDFWQRDVAREQAMMDAARKLEEDAARRGMYVDVVMYFVVASALWIVVAWWLA